MHKTYSEKVLKTLPVTTFTFYKNIEIKKVQSQYRIRNQKKAVTVAENLWCDKIDIAKKQIDNLVLRLNDTPEKLYEVIRNKQNRQKQNKKPKFLALDTCYLETRIRSKRSEANISQSKLQGLTQPTSRDINPCREVTLLKKIEKAKKKYADQYRKMLLGMKTLTLQTDLPRIKYVEQNQLCAKINNLHKVNKL